MIHYWAIATASFAGPAGGSRNHPAATSNLTEPGLLPQLGSQHSEDVAPPSTFPRPHQKSVAKLLCFRGGEAGPPFHPEAAGTFPSAALPTHPEDVTRVQIKVPSNALGNTLSNLCTPQGRGNWELKEKLYGAKGNKNNLAEIKEIGRAHV